MKFLGLLLLVGTLVAAAAPEGNFVAEKDTAIFPGEKGSALVQKVSYHPPEGVTGYWTPQASDLAGLEINLEKFLRQRNVPREKWDWSHYRRQVTGVIIKDQKLIFIYYTPKPGRDDPKETWKTEPVIIYDGFIAIFRVLFDPEKKNFVWYESNGPA